MREFTYSTFCEAIDKLTLYIDMHPISKVDFLVKNEAIIINSFFTKTNQRNLILHPGSDLTFVYSIIYFAFFSFIKNYATDENWLFSLVPGDKVIHTKRNCRCKVVELNKKENKISILDDSGCKSTLIINNLTANILKRYSGTATSLDGRGIRKKQFSHEEFFSVLFNIDKELIISTIDISFVVVCQKHEAELIMNSTALSFQGKEPIKLGDLFPAAYFTSVSDWINYSGNSFKEDPVIKFTNKISIARELVMEDQEKKIHGIIVYGSEYFLSGISELNDLLVRRSLPNVIMLAPITYGDYTQLLGQYEDVKLFAWTKEALLSKIEDLYCTNGTSIISEKNADLLQVINNLCENDLKCEIINSSFDQGISTKCRLVLHKLKNNLLESDEKGYFITYGFSLLKLLEQACFPISIMENLINDKLVNVLSPKSIFKQLDDISQLISAQNNNFADDVKFVLESLTSIYGEIYYSNLKFEYIKSQLVETRDNHKIAIIMPKEHYCKVFLECFNESEQSLYLKCDFTTPKKFNRRKMYKKVYVLSVTESLDFNISTLSNTEQVTYVCYPFEKWKFDLQSIRTINLMDYYDKHNNIEYDYFGFEDQSKISCHDNVEEVERELEVFIDNIILKTSFDELNKSVQAGGSATKVDKFVTFETGECVFFTAHYLPYKYNSVFENVEETDINSIVSGDTLVFANIDEENNDIVDKVICKLMDLNHLTYDHKEAYRKCRHWKEALRKYMNQYNLTYFQIAKQLEDLGRGKHEVTIRSWLNEDSRIIGPRDSESFYSIALITNDKEMLDDPDGFCEACREIRSIRIKILKYIGKLIVHSVGGNPGDSFEETLHSIAGDIRQMARLLQIEKVKNVDIVIPSYMANRIRLIV